MASSSGTGGAKTRRKAVATLVAFVAGVLLAVAHASILVGCIATIVLVAIFVPWIELGGRRGR